MEHTFLVLYKNEWMVAVKTSKPPMVTEWLKLMKILGHRVIEIVE